MGEDLRPKRAALSRPSGDRAERLIVGQRGLVRVTNRTRRGSKFTIGDDTPSSPFEVLRAQLEDEKKLDERREQVKWLIRSGEL
jgi:hypothetical protein